MPVRIADIWQKRVSGAFPKREEGASDFPENSPPPPPPSPLVRIQYWLSCSRGENLLTPTPATLQHSLGHSALYPFFHSCFHVALRPWRRDGLLGTGTVGRERQSEGSTAETVRKRPERPWTAARTMEVLRRCSLAIAQRLVHCATAVSTAVLDRVTKTMSVAPLLTNNLDNSKQKMSNLLSPASPPYSWSLLGKFEGPTPPPSSKISWSFDLAWNPRRYTLGPSIYICNW